MKEKSLRNWLTQGFRRVLIKRSREVSAETLQKPAIVFSPHQDDETLGCGGTIIRKTAAGADVQIVFMTDGHQSHKHLMAPSVLSNYRKQEAINACAVLGVPQSNIVFLDFPDGSLLQHQSEAAERVGKILKSSTATNVYLPFWGEPTGDHQATYAIVRKALAAQARTYTIFEYIVWYWHHWPWVSFFQEDAAKGWFVVKNSVKALGGLGLFRFGSRVSVSAVQSQKWAALREHKSQMTQLLDDPAWLTLHDVSNGEFINNLFQNYELFREYVYKPVDETH